MTGAQRWTVAGVTALLLGLPSALWRLDLQRATARCEQPALAATRTGTGDAWARPAPQRVRCDGIGSPLRGAAAVLFEQRLDVNTATARELAAVPGLSRAVARAIVDERSAHGPYEQLAALRRVPGIGERRLARIAPYLATATGAPADPPPAP